MDEKVKLKNGVISNLKAVLVSVKGCCPLAQVVADYRSLMGESIPFKKLGFNTLDEFIKSENAFKTYPGPNGQLMVDVVRDSATSHIVEMVSKQKLGKKKPAKRSRFVSMRSTGSMSTRKPSQDTQFKNKSFTPIQYKQPVKGNRYKPPSRPKTENKENESFTKNNAKKALTYTSTTKPTPAASQNKSAVRHPPKSFETEKPVKHSNSINYNNNHLVNNSNEKGSMMRQFSNKSEDDPLKCIPPELLRDVPYTELSLNDIIERVYSPCVKTPSSATSNVVDNPSVFSFPEINDLDNDLSPLSSTKSNLSRNGSYSSSIDDSPFSLNIAPRGRGRFIRRPLNDSDNQPNQQLASTTCMDLNKSTKVNTQYQDIVSKTFEMNNSPFVDDINDLPEDEKKLITLMRELDINLTPDIKVVTRKQKHGSFLFDAKVTIGTDVKCSSWPGEYPTSEAAREVAISKAMEELKKMYEGKVKLPVSLDRVVGARLLPLIENSSTGIWSDKIQEIYTEKYKERLPDRWLIEATKIGIHVEHSSNGNCILSFSGSSSSFKEESSNSEHESLTPSIDNSISELDSSIPEPDIPTAEDGYLSVVITCTASTTDISFRVIGNVLSVQYKRLTSEIERYFSTVAEQILPVQKDKIFNGSCFATCVNETWMRVRVLEQPQVNGSDSSNIEVLCNFVDHGHENSVPISNLYCLPSEFCQIPAQAIHCSLVGLEDLYDIDIVNPYLEELLGKYMFAKILDNETSEGLLNVVLFDTSGLDDVNVNLDIISKIAKEASTPTLKATDTIREMEIVHTDNDAYVYLQEPNGVGYNILSVLMQRVCLKVDDNQNLIYVQHAKDVAEDELYLARYSDDLLYRCKINKILLPTNQVDVQFIDYGNTMLIDFNQYEHGLMEISQFSRILLEIPPQYINALLFHNTPNIPSDISEQLVSKIGYSGGVLVKVVVPANKPGETSIVEIFKRESDGSLCSINRTLGLLMREPKTTGMKSSNGKLELKKAERTEKTFDLSSFPSNSNFPSTGDLPAPKLPPAGTFFDVNIPRAVNPTNFFIQPYSDGSELKNWMCQLQAYYNNGPGYEKRTNLALKDIKPGRCYAALCKENTWYRACVNQTIAPDSVSAFFVDCGLYIVLKSSQLQPLAPKFESFPYQVVKARLHGVKAHKSNKWRMEDCQMFQTMVESKQFVAVIKEYGKDELHTSDMLLSVTLIDTSTDDDVYIDKVLIDKGIAISSAS